MNMNKNSFLVLMSTYNGERYLESQVKSIMAQEDVKVHLLIRDDGSKDNTIKLLDYLACQYDNLTYVKAENIGFVHSFNKLVTMAFNSQYAYYAFVDQDDVWHKDKLKNALQYLEQQQETMPSLFCSNSTLIDAEGNNIGLFNNYMPHYTK